MFIGGIYYCKVLAVNGSQMRVVNEQGLEYSIGHSITENECYDPHNFTSEESMTRTALVAKFNEVGDAIYTVNFNKQPKWEDAFDAVANKGKLKSNDEIKKALKAEMKGEERTLVGYTVSRDVSLGRSMVVDLEQENKDDRIRQVDHRTLNWFICKGVKYSVKSK